MIALRNVNVFSFSFQDESFVVNLEKKDGSLGLSVTVSVRFHWVLFFSS